MWTSGRKIFDRSPPRPRILLAALALAACPTLSGAQTLDAGLLDRVSTLVEADRTRLEATFKDLHSNPELGFMETRTASIIAERLNELGYTVRAGIGKTGVVGILENGEGPTVMYRADMDANAVEEATGLPYASTVRVRNEAGEEVPVAHMCGHDAHVTWLLGVAKIMVELKAQWQGTLVLVTQPAEELIEGAAAMIDDGLYSKYRVPVPDYLFAMHTTSLFPTGYVGSGSGAIMAGTDQIDVLFKGVGGHGSSPHYTIDPVVMAAAAVMQYQTAVSRTVNPQQPAVLTVGSIQAGTANNVIPEQALLKLNLRYFDLSVRQQLIESIERINRGIAVTYGVPEDRLPTMTMKGYSPPLVNDGETVDRLIARLATLLGQDRIAGLPRVMGSEDAHVLRGEHEDVPVAYVGVGTAPPELFAEAKARGNAMPFFNHSPNYIVDLDAIALGTRVGAVAVLELLSTP